jgi:shikimate dehydrogenase
MVVNASPVGMRADDGLPGTIRHLDPGTLVGDVVIREGPTPLIRLAMQSKCHWVDGYDLFAGQIEELSAFLTSAARRRPSH